METNKPRSAQRQEPPVPARRNSSTSLRGGELNENNPGSQPIDDNNQRRPSSGQVTPRQESHAAGVDREKSTGGPETGDPSEARDSIDGSSQQKSDYDNSTEGPKVTPSDSDTARKQLTNIREELEEPQTSTRSGEEYKSPEEDSSGNRVSSSQRPRSSPRSAHPRTPRKRSKGDIIPEVGGDTTTGPEPEKSFHNSEKDSGQREHKSPAGASGENITNNNGDMGVEDKPMGDLTEPKTDENEGTEPEAGSEKPLLKDGLLLSEIGTDSGMGSAGEESYADANQSPGGTRALVPHNSRSDGNQAYPGDRTVRSKLAEGRQKAFSGKSTLSTRTSTSAISMEGGEDDIDSINVAVRVRPMSTQESNRKDSGGVSYPGNGTIHVEAGTQAKTFTFNVTFEPEASQEDVFENCGVKKLVEMALDGYSCTAFAFGQTGSGKTHTITGPPELFVEGNKPEPDMYGLIPRSFHYLFMLMNSKAGKDGTGYRLFASYMEIYNEQVIDLLNPNQRRPLAVRWSKNKGFYVENLFVLECETMDDIMAVLEEGLRNRATGSNSVNEHSSRSHSMLTLHIDSEMQDPEDETLYITKHGKLTFVDLAGSEKVKTETKNEAGHLAESNNINKSLLVLGNCISALGDAKRRQGHIPYRDSKLTKLLADSLGGNGVTLMIACVSPSLVNGAETLNTLRYANRAKKIKTKPAVKMDPREKLIMSLKREIKILRQENHYLRQQLDFPPKPDRYHIDSPAPIPEESEEKKDESEKTEDESEENRENKEEKNTSDEREEPKKKEEDEIDENALEFPPRKKGQKSLEFPVKPKGQLQRENDEKFLVMLKEAQNNGGKGVSDNGLYEMLQEYMIENETLRTENSDLHQLRDSSRREQQVLARENEKLSRKLEALERERIIMQTPLSIYSLGSASSRQTSASELNFERTPHTTPQAWGHGPPPMEYYGRDSTNGSWANQTLGRQALVRGHSNPSHQDNIPSAWGTPQSTPFGTPFGTPRVTPLPYDQPSGPMPSYGGPSKSKNPPPHLQHPMRPPHRLSEPVKQGSPSDPVPSSIPNTSPYSGGVGPPSSSGTYVMAPRGSQHIAVQEDFSGYIAGYYNNNNQRQNNGYMTRYYQQQDYYRDHPQPAAQSRNQSQHGNDYQSGPVNPGHYQGAPGHQNYSQAPPQPQNYPQGHPQNQNYNQGPPHTQTYVQGPPDANSYNHRPPPPPPPPQGYPQSPPVQPNYGPSSQHSYAQGAPPPQNYGHVGPPPAQHLPEKARNTHGPQRGYGSYSQQEPPVPTPRRSKGGTPTSQVSKGSSHASKGSYSKTGGIKKQQAAKNQPPPPPPQPNETIEAMNERLRMELYDLEGAIQKENRSKGPATNGYGGRR